MAFRPLQKWSDEHNKGKGIIWMFVVSVIDDALDYLFTLISEKRIEAKNSVTVDTDGKTQLVNDLSDAELLPNLVYGTDSNGTRGYKYDTGGHIGTKQVDETGLTNGYILYYDAVVDKWKTKLLPTSSQGSGRKIISLPYKLWREALGVVFTGYTDIEIQISTNMDFTNIIKNVNSNSVNRADFSFFSATEGIYKGWMDTGVPATDILDIIYTGDLNFTYDVYIRWRMIEHGTENYGEWLPLGVMR